MANYNEYGKVETITQLECKTCKRYLASIKVEAQGDYVAVIICSECYSGLREQAEKYMKLITNV